ncbi:penicillin acylase family protein [Streptomyces sp. NBC_01537]|uniref:penicillin acylase family protein n=1 Tax=Streptomyces sp. NBC_01537 TaxID=2903896 RepID=UPI00386BFD62
MSIGDIKGVEGIEVHRDAWGIPHLRAGSPDELAFAQGRNAATDRAWQIEVERHRSQGTTAAFLGPEAVGWDRFARQSRLDDTARRCFRRLDGRTRAWITSYVDGVSAGLTEGAAHAPQFAATGLAPGRWEPWTPLGVWLSTHILFAGFPAKLWREEVARHLGDEAIELFATDGPGTSGSNGWLVSGERTHSGSALIAGDPHRFIEDPGIYQQVHLACPEYDVAGLAVPGVPGLPHFGHAGGVAWAITNAMADYHDLYRERLRRTDAGVEALGPDGWRPATVHVETVQVAGAEPVAVEVIETERGPVVIGGADGPLAISLRYPPRVREELGFAALPALLRATTVADVDRALDGWAEPVNVVHAADTAGGLLHRVAGAVPLRSRDNRLRVVPAWEPGHEWLGWHDPLPREPVDGVAVMANERGLAEPVGVEFAPPYRAWRIRQLLDASVTWSAEDMALVHTDTHLGSARPLLELLATLDGLSPPASALQERLLGWDRRMGADSTDATSYAAVRGAVVRRLGYHPALDGLTESVSGPAYPALFRPWLALLPRVAYALESLLTAGLFPDGDLVDAVRAAVEEVAAEAAAPAPWGEVHRLAPRQTLPDAEPEDWPGLAGDHDCVLATSSVPGLTDSFARGPSARYVWDLARRDDSLWIVPLGASGIPGDPHQRDQLPLWARGELAPVVTDWDVLHARTAPGCVHEQKLSTGFCVVRCPSRARPLCPGQGACMGQCWTARGRCPSRLAPWCCAHAGAPTWGRPSPRSWPQPGGCRTRPRSTALCDLWGCLSPKVSQAAQLPETRRDGRRGHVPQAAQRWPSRNFRTSAMVIGPVPCATASPSFSRT